MKFENKLDNYPNFYFLAIIALIVCHVTSNVASTANNAHHDHILSTGHPSASDLEHDLEDLKVSFKSRLAELRS